jgi:adenylate cyclase
MPWGGRARLMERFVSPQVAEFVSRRGLNCASECETLEISVVCSDLRGFTAFSEVTSSPRVLQILREYYEAAGAAAAEYGGTIKDQAGDGVLILVGAPVPFADHARRALLLAKRLRANGIELSSRWCNAAPRLGVGIGVASGRVSVGVLGAGSRLEYTAVGPAVNLASRLCAQAEHGQLLISQRTTDLLDADSQRGELYPGNALQLKGIEHPVQSYSLRS